MTLYGLYGFTHGWTHVLTVMSPEGARAALEHIEPTDDVIVYAGDGRLTQYHEKTDGALERMVSRCGIEILEKDEWDEKKAELGDAIL